MCVGVDKEFERLLVDIFGADFMDVFKQKRPAGWVDLLLAFESRKRAATPFKSKPLNVSLPFSFTDYHQKYKVTTLQSLCTARHQLAVLHSSLNSIHRLHLCILLTTPCDDSPSTISTFTKASRRHVINCRQMTVVDCYFLHSCMCGVLSACAPHRWSFQIWKISRLRIHNRFRVLHKFTERDLSFSITIANISAL